MKNLPVSAVGMVWYSLEHFDEIKAMMKDGHKLHRTYTEWRLAAEQGERHMRRQGHFVVRAHLVPDVFREFCSRHGLDFDADGRNHFANRVAAEKYAEAQRAQGGGATH